ncbi:UDP-glucose 4-epimerase GalE [uncultured Nevskia sp.]|uniref:UDP-glucose 4-epimerase GalE n=1 Tax=uncultured Nevskia sp. TaxID=228950 RepID=UPI0025DB6C51|nr:UDP-glucose 4-epimerase GalE [uncultured Nevskia sp.]
MRKPSSKPLRLLVCGGAGYIGSHMCKLLAEHGHEVAVVDNLSTGHAEAVRWGELHVGDIGDSALLDRVFSDFRPEGVLHFAGKSIVEESITDPASYYLNNFSSSLKLFEQVRKIPDCPVIFSSTAAIFGEPQSDQITEAHPKYPINAYGRSKLAVEQLLQDYWTAYSMPSMCFRYFNAAGADPAGNIGEAHHPETHLIPRVFDSILGVAGAVKVFGNDYGTPDGTCVRDFVHVEDLCNAHLLGIEFLKDRHAALTFNLGNGVGFSVMEVLKAAQNITGIAVPYQFTGRRPGDSPRLVADSSAAREYLGWTPQYTELPHIMKTAWNWHRDRKF